MGWRDSVKISKWFTKLECTRSTTAARHGIANEPNANQWKAIEWFMQNCMDLVRDLFGVPIVPNSVFRSLAVNTLVGGSKSSDHMKGYACDFVVPGIRITDTVKQIRKAGIEFDQLIDEYGQWVHISCKPNGNRHQVLMVRRIGVKSVWTTL